MATRLTLRACTLESRTTLVMPHWKKEQLSVQPLGKYYLYTDFITTYKKFSMKSQLSNNQDYQNLLIQIKRRIQKAQLKAVVAVNKEMLILYWHIGRLILERQERQKWGARVLEQLAQDLKKGFPEMQGLSRRNLFYMRKFAASYPNFTIVQPVVAQISWSHNIILLDKFNNSKIRLWYAQQSLQNSWSKRQLIREIDTNLYERQGKAIPKLKISIIHLKTWQF